MTRNIKYEADKINAMVQKLAILQLEIEDPGYDYSIRKAELQSILDGT